MFCHVLELARARRLARAVPTGHNNTSGRSPPSSVDGFLGGKGRLAPPSPAPILGGLLAATQPIEKLASKLDFGVRNGLLSPGNPSSQVLGESMGFRREEEVWTPKIRFLCQLLNGLGGCQRPSHRGGSEEAPDDLFRRKTNGLGRVPALPRRARRLDYSGGNIKNVNMVLIGF
jgi:hypothetical protein